MRASLREKLKNKEFVVTAELVPPLAGSGADVVAEAQKLYSQVDAINVTDGAGARSAMSGTVAACLLANAGYEPVLQLTCRDRNRLALVGDLLGAAAFGVQNVLVLGGDDPSAGDQPDAKGVFDLNTTELLEMIEHIRSTGQLPNGRPVSHAPQYLIGAADIPGDPGTGYDPARLASKVEAGARFVQTQIVFETDRVRRYIDCLADAGVLDSAGIIVGLGIAKSLKSAQWMDANLYGIDVPDYVLQRFADAEDQSQEGIAVAAELLATLAEMEGVAGVHLMAPGGTADSVLATAETAGVLRPPLAAVT